MPRGFAPFSPGVENITVNSTPKNDVVVTATFSISDEKVYPEGINPKSLKVSFGLPRLF